MTVRLFTLIVGVETDDLGTNATVDSVFLSTKAVSYTLLDDDDIGTVLVSDTSVARTITLPTAADNTSRRIMIKKTGSGANEVIVDCEGAETLDGQGSVNIEDQFDFINVQSDGANWHIIGEVPAQLIQDFIARGSVGTAAQQEAGHILDSDSAGLTDEAFYKFASGALVDDETGNFDLTNNNAVTNTDGITGSDFAAEFNGVDQYFSHATLLDDITGDTSILISFWFKPDDGQPAGIQYIFVKQNVAGEDRIFIDIQTPGRLRFLTEEGNNGDISLWSGLIMPNGAGTWRHAAFCWDTTHGKRIFINGVLDTQDLTATTLMGNGTGEDAQIGALVGPSGYFAGDIALLKIYAGTTVVTQKHIDMLYSYRYAKPAIFSGNEYKLHASIQKDGSSSFEQEYDINSKIVHKDSDYIYRAGGVITGLNATDKLKIKAR